MTEEELEQRRRKLQKKFTEERKFQEAKSGFEDYQKEQLKKSLHQIQTEFDIEILSDEEVERINIDLTTIKRVLIQQGKDMSMLEEEYNRLLQLLFTKEREIIHLEAERRNTQKDIIEMKRIILQQQKRINNYENELMILQNEQKTI